MKQEPTAQTAPRDPVTPLNLPPAQIAIRTHADGVREIFDTLRGKWVALTPEEWVRQNFTAWLGQGRGYPAALMANEVGIRVNRRLRRCDTVVYDRSLHPIAIVEYKAPSVAVTQRVFDQIARYNLALGARVLIVSNGLEHYCCRYRGGAYTFLREVPRYEEI